MTELLNVLIIEDHPLIVNAYENALRLISENNNRLEFDIAINCVTAIEKRKRTLKELFIFNKLII